MKLARNTRLDALCGEYLIGTLRGAARRRFERALKEEPGVARQLEHWQRFTPGRYTQMVESQPPAQGWQRLERELDLARYRTPWHRRATFWRGWAVTATAALVLFAGGELLTQAPNSPQVIQIAQLASEDSVHGATAHLSKDGRTFVLHTDRPMIAGPAQSYELWLIPANGKPVSVAVLGSLDARFELPRAHRGRMLPGAQLAVSAEPAGGSPTGQPTGPVIFKGPIGI